MPFQHRRDNISNHTTGSSITTQSRKPGDGIFYGWVIVMAASLVAFIAFGFYQSFGVFFQDLQNEFGASRAEISLVASILAFTFSIMGLTYGWVTDKYGPRIAVGIGGILMCTGLIVSSRAASVAQLYLSFFVVGCGIGAATVPGISTLIRWFVKMRGFAQGIRVAIAGVGTMVVAPLSARFLISYGWRFSFVILGIACLALFSISAFLLRKSPEEKGLLPYGVAEHDDRDVDIGHTAGSSAEKSSSLREAMRTRALWLISGAMLTTVLAIFMVSAHLVNYAKDAGMSPHNAALLMSIIGGAGIPGRLGVGFLADKVGGRKIIVGCASILAVLMIWLSNPMSIWMFRVFAIIYGFAYAGIFPIINILVAETFGVAHIGKIMGFARIGNAIGGVLGPWIAGYVFDVTESYSLAFLIAAGASVVTIVLISLVGKGAHRAIATESP